MTAPSVAFDHVSKTYPSARTGKTGSTPPVPAVNDFSLEIPGGTLLVFLGSSGSGKTTLLRMVNRMVNPDSGQVLLDGIPTSQRDPIELRRSIGYAIQGGGLFPHKTVADNIATVPRLNGETRRAARAAALDLMPRVNLDPALADRYPSELSGGQAQRVSVARALASNPKMLLLDEPFGAVDPVTRADLQAELAQIHADTGATILLVTHDVDEALMLGQQIVLLADQARLAQLGTPTELLTRPADDFVRSFLGIDSRRLHVQEVDGEQIVIDGLGRPAGILAQ